MLNGLDARRRGWVLAVGLLGLLRGADGGSRPMRSGLSDPAVYPIRWELVFSLPVGVALATAALALAALLVLRRIVRDPLWPNPDWLRPVNASAPAVIGVQTAVSLIYMAVQGWLFSPVLALPRNGAGAGAGRAGRAGGVQPSYRLVDAGRRRVS